LSFSGLGFSFALGVKGLGGVLSIFRKTSSRVGSLVIPDPSIDDFPDELMPALTMVLGQLILTWGNIEASLNMAISIIYHDANGKTIEPDIPRTALWKRIEFMTDCANKLPSLEPHREMIIRLMGRVERHAERIRNPVLHGFFSDYAPETGQLTFTSLRGNKDHHEVSHLEGSLEDLNRASAAAQALANDVIILQLALSKAFLRAENEGN
jgi:hypothetical protein